MPAYFLSALSTDALRTRVWYDRGERDVRKWESPVRKHTVLIALVAAALGFMLLGSCVLGIAAIKYVPVLMKRVGVADRYITEFALLPPGSLTVANPNGDVTLRTGDVQRVQVEAVKITHSATEAQARRMLSKTSVRTDRDDHHARIEVVLPQQLLGQDPRVNLTITIPRDTTLSVASQNGDIHISLLPDAEFGLDARTQRGRIQSTFPLVDQESGHTGIRKKGQWLRGRIHDNPSVQLVLRTKAGDIEIQPLDTMYP